MIGRHPCYTPGKDMVVPVFAPPSKWSSSPWLAGGGAGDEGGAGGAVGAGGDGAGGDGAGGDGAGGGGVGVGASSAWWRSVHAPRPTLAYFSGNLALNEPLKYARGIRHRLHRAFHATPGWKLVGKSGGRYSLDLSQSEFCLVPPGGDGWSSRVDDAVRHGCIPVILMDGVHMPFETLLNYSAFSVRVPERDVEKLDAILRSIGARTRRRMRAEMRRLWTRFVYARAFLDADAFLPASRTAELPRDHLVNEPALVGLHAAVEGRGAPDAFETIMLELAARKARWHDAQRERAR